MFSDYVGDLYGDVYLLLSVETEESIEIGRNERIKVVYITITICVNLC